MPIYEYRCDACGHYLDALQKIADDPLRDCPSCEASALRRLVSAPNFRLKGSGWYETDFKSDKETKRNLVDRPEESAPGKDKDKDKGDSGKTESGKGEGVKAGGDSKQSGGDSKERAGAGKKPPSFKGRSSGGSGADAGSKRRTRSPGGAGSAAA